MDKTSEHTTLELLQMDETTVYAKHGYIVIEQQSDSEKTSVWIAPDRLQDVMRAMTDAEEFLFPIAPGPAK
jgi:hypothetical protein